MTSKSNWMKTSLRLSMRRARSSLLCSRSFGIWLYRPYRSPISRKYKKSSRRMKDSSKKSNRLKLKFRRKSWKRLKNMKCKSQGLIIRAQNHWNRHLKRVKILRISWWEPTKSSMSYHRTTTNWDKGLINFESRKIQWKTSMLS